MKTTIPLQNIYGPIHNLNFDKESLIFDLHLQVMNRARSCQSENSVLGKRENPFFISLPCEELNKKVKCSNTSIVKTKTEPKVLQPLDYSQEFKNNGFEKGVYSCQTQVISRNINEKIRYLRHLQHLINIQQDIIRKEKFACYEPSDISHDLSNNLFMPINALKPEVELLTRKEQLTKKEETQETFRLQTTIDNNNLSSAKENNDVVSEGSKKGKIEEPVLFELTKRFPHWNLSTILNFFESGQSMLSFEKNRQLNHEKKRRKRKEEA